MNDEVKSKNFKAIFSIVAIDFLFNGAESHICNLFDSGPNFHNFFFRNEIFELPERKLVTTFECSIVLAIFLNCIVGKMDEVVIDILG